MATQKKEWPELVGKTPEEAEAQVLKDRPDATVIILKAFDACKRGNAKVFVKIFYNKEGTVAEPPRIE